MCVLMFVRVFVLDQVHTCMHARGYWFICSCVFYIAVSCIFSHIHVLVLTIFGDRCKLVMGFQQRLAGKSPAQARAMFIEKVSKTSHHLKGVKGDRTFSCERHKRGIAAAPLLRGVLFINT